MAYILPPPSPMSLLFLHSKFDFFLTPPPFLDNVTNFTKTQKLNPRKKTRVLQTLLRVHFAVISHILMTNYYY